MSVSLCGTKPGIGKSEPGYVSMDDSKARKAEKTTQSIAKRALGSLVGFLMWIGEPVIFGVLSQAMVSIYFPTASLFISVAVAFAFGASMELVCCIARSLINGC